MCNVWSRQTPCQNIDIHSWKTADIDDQLSHDNRSNLKSFRLIFLPISFTHYLLYYTLRRLLVGVYFTIPPPPPPKMDLDFLWERVFLSSPSPLPKWVLAVQSSPSCGSRGSTVVGAWSHMWLEDNVHLVRSLFAASKPLIYCRSRPFCQFSCPSYTFFSAEMKK